MASIHISVRPCRGGWRVEVRGGGLDSDSNVFDSEADAIARAQAVAAALEESGVVDAKTRRVHGGGGTA